MPLHRVAVVRPFTQLLAEVGAPIERHFRLAGLPYYALESADNYVPSQRFWAFLVNTAYREAIEDLGFRVGQRFGANCADPHLTSLLRESPTMYQGLLKASSLTNRTITNCRVGILQPSDCSYSLFYHQPSCDVDNPAIEQIGWFGLMTLLGMVREFTGPKWQPSEIGIMTGRMPGPYIREHFPHTRIRRRQPFSYITLENSLLCLPPLTAENARSVASPYHYKSVPDDFIGTLEQIMQTYIQDDLTIEVVAGLCNTSKRTLQRQLTETGTRYSEVHARVWFRVACQMLQRPDSRVKDVARRLGYNDVSHFSRAFRRMAGLTPRAYRQHCKQDLLFI